MRWLAIAVSIILRHGTARAEPAAGEPYTGRIVVTDLSATAGVGLGGIFIMGGVIAGSRPSFVLGGALAAGSLVTYVIGPPLHHLQRGNPRGAMRSALARLGLPIAGALVAHLSDRQASDDRAVIGAVIGVGAAMIVDAAVIARMPARTVLVTASGEGAVHIGIAGAF